MSTVVLRQKRRYPYSYIDGYFQREKRTDEVLLETVDFSNELAASDYISSTSWDTSGPTISGTATATGINGTSNTAVTFSIEGTGTATLTVVTNDGETLERRFKWVGTNDDLEDYRE